MITSRQFLDFFKSKPGQFAAFAGVVFVGCVLVFGFTHGSSPKTAAPIKSNLPGMSSADTGPVIERRNEADADGLNKPIYHPLVDSTNGAPMAPVPLPISLYHSSTDETEVSDTYAPYGRLIPCETVITIDSAKIETPIIGFVTEDVWHDGKLIIPAGAEVHGRAQVDPSRERIASEDNWVLVWRTTDRMNGAELPLHGVALDMERNETTGTWQLTDGSAGLKGDILKTDNWAEIKLFAATFLSAATTGLENTTTSSNALTGQTTQTPLDTPKNAALEGASAVLNQYAQQILDSIKRDGFYVRVPAGKQFYLYVTQTIDLDNAKRGESLVDLKPENSKP
ncbi:MAG TPA: TrbI/VirB10 family protein [Candidatus Methylacidiphilales bacterium]|jgi:hypothetical protein|nr:TrbI/VirB10 family protein [Candidatus Methylacidiphilales bacterium]